MNFKEYAEWKEASHREILITSFTQSSKERKTSIHRDKNQQKKKGKRQNLVREGAATMKNIGSFLMSHFLTWVESTNLFHIIH